MMNSAEIRQHFLDFFKSKGHQIVPSAPIVIKNDPTLLFTNAGMFKEFFLGNKPAPYSRIADTQKCLRVSGKHNDLEEVGVDTYHHTMFEMLGNWSFGNVAGDPPPYFKEQAIAWAWDLLTQVYKIPESDLYVTVFEGDEKEGLPRDHESLNFWKNRIQEDRIVFGNKKDNFWEMGDTGPCGPSTEIHVDCRTGEAKKMTPGKELINRDNPQVIEIWNVVFIQYNRKKDGSLELLPAKHVDTGMGFERLVRVLQNKMSNYDTDIFTGTIAEIEKISGKISGRDFYLGYSPERINPGDKLHTIDRITKVVSGQTPEVAEILKHIYGSINNGNIFVARNIKTAEAAKVIENAQRDINIAFINEIATIVGKLGISIYDVLDAANTKWNFLRFQPGLVGGHCIGVDPYYLAECARDLNHEPEVILAGRKINEGMGFFIANTIHQKLKHLNLDTNLPSKNARILVLGLTFKEDIPDLRNTKVVDVIEHLKKFGHTVDVHDPFADPIDAKAHYGLNLLTSFQDLFDYDCIIGAVSHQPYLKLSKEAFKTLIRPSGLIADIKNMWKDAPLPEETHYWTL